jgi:hypothetical protein
VTASRTSATHPGDISTTPCCERIDLDQDRAERRVAMAKVPDAVSELTVPIAQALRVNQRPHPLQVRGHFRTG